MAHQHVPFVKTKDTTNHELFVIATWDFLRGIRSVEPTGCEFDLCDCTARRLYNQCHADFEKAQIEKALSYYEGESPRYARHSTCSGVR